MRLAICTIIGLTLGIFLDLYLGFPRCAYVILAVGFALRLGNLVEEWDKGRNKTRPCSICLGAGSTHFGMTTDKKCLVCKGTGRIVV